MLQIFLSHKPFKANTKDHNYKLRQLHSHNIYPLSSTKPDNTLKQDFSFCYRFTFTEKYSFLYGKIFLSPNFIVNGFQEPTFNHR